MSTQSRISPFYKVTTILLVTLLLLTGFAVTPARAASILTVTSLDDIDDGVCSSAPGHCSFREAVRLALDGDTVNFGVTGTITLDHTYGSPASGEITIGKNLTITGPGASSLTLKGTGLYRLFYISNAAYTVNISGLTIDGFSAPYDTSVPPVQGNGGAIYKGGAATLNATNVVFKNNTAGAGGAVFSNSGGGGSTFTICTFDSNATTGTIAGGGAIEAVSAITVTDSYFKNNHTTVGGTQAGGAIRFTGGGTVTGSTFESNSSEGGTGGAISLSTAAVTIKNSTFYGNSTTATGGALYNSNTTADLYHVTMSDNTAGSGQGGSIGKPTGSIVNLYDSILVKGTGSFVNCLGGGSLVNQGGNFQYGDTTCTGTNSNPLLAALADNGGPTRTMRLQAGSPAINAATTNCQTPDQRGLARPIGTYCDSGAYEVEATAPDTTASGLPTNPTASRDASFILSGTDNIFPASTLLFECKLETTGTFAACTSPKSYTGLVDGTHNFYVHAIDLDGNTDVTPFQYTWVIDGTPPNTSITSTLPANPTNVTSASFSFTGTDPGRPSAVLTYKCSLDGAPVTTCTSPVIYPTLAAGSHTFTVAAVDELLNIDASPATYTWTVDTTAPETIISTTPNNPANTTAAVFTFTGTDNVTLPGSLTFQCKVDGASFLPCTSGSNFGTVAENASHTFYVKAKDAATNEDPTPAEYTWYVDTIEPTTQIDSQPASLTKSPDAIFTFSGTDDHSGVASYECNKDSGGWAACTSGANFGPMTQGTHTFQVRSVDGAGNRDSSPAPYSWFVDLTEPNTTITPASKPADPTNAIAASFVFAGIDNHSAAGALTFECQLDSGGWSTCTSPKAYASLGDGAHTFEVRATDEALNTESTPDSYSWTVDTVEPTTSLDSHPADPISSTSAAFTFSGADNLVISGSPTFECKLETGGAWGTCTSPKNYTGLAVGSHTFYVKAKDKAGNEDSTPAEFTWFVDLTEPNTTITPASKPANPTNATTASFEFAALDNHSASGSLTFECKLESGGSWGACSSPKAYASLGNGSHTFYVRATDEAGNIETSPDSYTWVVDTVTQAPTLTKPAASENYPADEAAHYVQITYTLPETPKAGSVTLTFQQGTNTYALGMVDDTSVSFQLDPYNVVGSPKVVSGSNIPTGQYTVTLSYQDALSNPAATDDSINVKVGYYTISGNTFGLGGVLLSFEDPENGGLKTATSATGGNYSLRVSYGWSGRVTPYISGNTFVPRFKEYTNVTANKPGEDYSGTTQTYSISGTTSLDGNPLGGVTLSWFDYTPQTAISDPVTGSYTLSVSYDWTGDVTPSKVGYTFSPTKLSYAHVLSNQTGQNYTATGVTYTISGNAGVAGATLNYTGGTTTADIHGNYSFTVLYNWSGAVTPSKAGYAFIPASRSYANVLADKTAQDFIATQTLTFTSVGSYDGWVLESTKTSNKGGSFNATAPTFQLGDDATDRQYRAILSFNTISLPDNAVIQSVTLKIKQVGVPTGLNPFKSLGGLLVDIRKGSFGGIALAKTDFQAAASAVKVATFNKTPVKNWYSASFYPTGNLQMINTMGVTQLRLYFTKGDNNNKKADFMNFASGNATATSRPQLIIVYSVPVP